jgi:hypothetical protein
MRNTTHSSFRRARGQYFAVATLATVGALGLFGCEYDDSDWHLDQESGATTSRGGTQGSAASSGKVGSGGASGSIGSGGSSTGGAGGVLASYPAPEIDALEPASGPYGTAVTITGKGLGNADLAGFTLAVGNQGEVELTPESDEVVSWSDDEIVFRYPFPAEGAVALEGPKGDALAGEFAPTWHIAQELETAPAATVIASISPEPGRIILLFDTMPLTLLEVGADGVVEQAVTATDVETTSLRLYLDAAKKLQGVGVSTGAEPVIVHLQNMAGDLVAVPTAIQLTASEYGVAGGSEGAAVWMRRAGGWQRARASAGGWTLDKGPIADPDPSAPDRASGASSDGSLYIAYSVDAGTGFPLYDDMEAPRMKRLAPTASSFSGAMAAGGAVDDYVTSLELRSSGDGVIVRVCGSDVDPFGLSGTSNYCFDSLHAPSGAQLSRVPVNAKASAHAFTHERAVAAYCSSDQNWMIRTDLDAVAEPEPSPGEIVLYPCPEAIALEVSGDGDYLPVVRYQQRTYLLERNPAAVVEPGGDGGAGGAGGAGGGAGEGGGP